MSKIQKFEDIEARQETRSLIRKIYSVTGQASFSNDYNLKDQIRRATVSVLSNIAEGFNRQSDKEFIRFLYMAKGRWQPIRRFDCVHRRSHIDDFNYKGERRRTWLDISYQKALTQAEDDIKRNWELYGDQFFQGRFPSYE